MKIERQPLHSGQGMKTHNFIAFVVVIHFYVKIGHFVKQNGMNDLFAEEQEIALRDSICLLLYG